jgi:hypothetical protein
VDRRFPASRLDSAMMVDLLADEIARGDKRIPDMNGVGLNGPIPPVVVGEI